MSIWQKCLKFIVDVSVTIVLWIYFIFGFVIVFSPFYAAAYLFSKDRRTAIQKINHRFFKGLLWLLRVIVPGLTIEVDKRIPALRSCVVVSNHRSYLDTVILVAAFEKQISIVKNDLFRFPILGSILNVAGYIPSEGSGKWASLFFERFKGMNDYLSEGGVLFVFPEGTRSRNGRMGFFSKGAFKIARRCNVPVEVIYIVNTDALFAPGRFLFNTCFENRIEARWIGRISPEDVNRTKIDELVVKARKMMTNNRVSG